jgi:hypothetical protein
VTADKIIVKVDSQILNSMDLCPERYRLEHIDHWRPSIKAGALEKGSVVHKMLAAYREGKKAGRTKGELHHELIEECITIGRVNASNSAMEFETMQEIEMVFKSYVLHWQYDGWEILDVEQPFTKVLYDSENLTILYEGIIDARVVDPKIGQAVVDSKTESRKSYPYVLSNQFQGYEWAFGVPVIIDKIGFQSSLSDKERFRRPVHESGAPALAEWVDDSINKVIEAIGWHHQLDRGERNTLHKNRTSCDKYSGCIFQKVCAAPEEVREFKLQAFFFKDVKWDPYTRDDEVVTEGATDV